MSWSGQVLYYRIEEGMKDGVTTSSRLRTYYSVVHKTSIPGGVVHVASDRQRCWSGCHGLEDATR